MKIKTDLTLERLSTELQGEIASEHLHRYAVAIELCKDKIVLDIACGEGYGTNLIANVASKVIGVDIDLSTINSASFKYKKDNLTFKAGSTSKIPLGDNSVDVVVSFETIEHHDAHLEMIKEIKRVLREDGILIISTPDKLNYSDKRNYQNKFHIKELYKEEFQNLLKLSFENVETFYQKMIYASTILSFEECSNIKEYTGSFLNINTNTDPNSIYIICIASDFLIPKIDNSYFIHSLEEVMRELIIKIRSSTTYKLGYILLAPFRLIKSLISK